MRTTIKWTAVAALFLGLLAPLPVLATSQDDLMREIRRLAQALENQGRMLKRQAEEINALKARLAGQDGKVQKNTARIEQVDKKADKQTKPPDLKALLGDRFKFATDLRLRYEGLYDRQSGNTSLEDRNRFRIRWRMFGAYQATDELSFHAMLTTSSGSWFDNGSASRNWQPGRTSNQTMDDEFNNKNIFIGRIYAAYQPKWLPGLELTAGKFKNTFMHSNMMWDPDLNPEGAYQRYQLKSWKVFQPFIHLGQLVVAENNKTDDAYLLLWQLGTEMHLGGLKWTLAGSYYDWVNLDKSDLSKVEGSSAGNSVGSDGLFLYDYKLVEGITFLEWKVAGLPLRLWFDYIVNTADGVPTGNDTAWGTGFMLGQTRKKGDYWISFRYAEIEPDSLVGAVSDGDFYGANRKGYKAQVRYTLYDPWVIGLTWFQTEAMVGPENSENRLQADMIFRFSL